MKTENEVIIKTKETKAGGIVSLIKPEKGLPFFRYTAPAEAIKDTFRYIITQFDMSDSATVNISINAIDNATNQTIFNEEFDHFFTCMTFFANGSVGTKTLRNMMNIEQGQYLNNEWIDTVFKDFSKVFPKVENGVFDFEKYIGTYTYNAEKGWIKSDSKGKIVINFPSSEKAEGNDTNFVIEEYTYSSTPIKTETSETYLPSTFRAFLQINDKDIFGAQLGKGERKIATQYHPSGLPIAFELDVFIMPYQIKFSTINKEAIAYETSFQITDKDGCSLQLNGKIRLKRNDFASLKELTKDDIVDLDGSLSINNLTLTNLGSIYDLVKIGTPTQEDVNKLFNVQVIKGDRKLGRLALTLEPASIDMLYPDGSSQNISKRMIDFFDLYFRKKTTTPTMTTGPVPASDAAPASSIAPKSIPKGTSKKSVAVPAPSDKVEGIISAFKQRFTLNLEPDPKQPGSISKLFKSSKPKGKQK